MKYFASILATGFKTLTGTVIAQDSGSVTFQYKRPRSSKYEQAVFPRSSIISLAEVADASYLTITDASAEVDYVQVDGNSIKYANNFVTFKGVNGEVYSVRESAVSFVGEVEDGASGKKGGKVKLGKKADKSDKADKGSKKVAKKK